MGAIASAVGGAFLGITGTFIGLAAGSMISSTAAWWIERGIRRSQAIAKAKADARKHRGGRELSPTETQAIEKITGRKFDLLNRGISWKKIAVIGSATLILALGVITAWEKIANKPLSDVVTGHKGHGLSITGGSTQPTQSPSYSPSPTFSPSTSFSTPTVSPSASPSSPSPAVSVTPTVSPTPSPSDPVSPSPTVSLAPSTTVP
jgi:hypothetical protein